MLFCRPDTLSGLLLPVEVRDTPAAVQAAEYDVTALPPLEVGALKASKAVVSPAVIAVSVGEPGAVGALGDGVDPPDPPELPLPPQAVRSNADMAATPYIPRTRQGHDKPAARLFFCGGHRMSCSQATGVARSKPNGMQIEPI